VLWHQRGFQPRHKKALPLYQGTKAAARTSGGRASFLGRPCYNDLRNHGVSSALGSGAKRGPNPGARRRNAPMRIDGIDNLTPAELEAELAAGGRFVFYEYCISLVVLSLRCPTRIRFLRAGEYGVLPGLPYVLVSLLLGWWGLPWG